MIEFFKENSLLTLLIIQLRLAFHYLYVMLELLKSTSNVNTTKQGKKHDNFAF